MDEDNRELFTIRFDDLLFGCLHGNRRLKRNQRDIGDDIIDIGDLPEQHFGNHSPDRHMGILTESGEGQIPVDQDNRELLTVGINDILLRLI